MTLREYIADVLGADIDSFLSKKLSTLLFAESGRIIPERFYADYLDYEIREIEIHIELERGRFGPNNQRAEYYIISIYKKKEEA